MSKKIHDVFEQASTTLEAICTNPQAAQQEAWWLIEKVTGKKKAKLLLDEQLTFSLDQEKTLFDLIRQRVVEKKPLQYIIGSVPFCGLEILVEPPILIPRPETEEWAAWLITTIRDAPLLPTFAKGSGGHSRGIRILDLGSGTGAIALALAHAFPTAQVTGIDINPNAVALAEKNKNHNHIKNVEFLCSDVYEKLPAEKQFDVIVSNPPYVTEQEFAELSEQVTKWEDKNALVAADQGLAIHKRIIQNARNYLKSNNLKIPHIVLEIGYTQAATVTKLFEQAGFKNIQVHQDLEGKDRWITAN